VADVAGKKVVLKTASYREDLKTCPNLPPSQQEQRMALLIVLKELERS